MKTKFQHFIKVQDFLLLNLIKTSHRAPYIFLVTTVDTITMDDTTTDLTTTMVETTSLGTTPITVETTTSENVETTTSENVETTTSENVETTTSENVETTTSENVDTTTATHVDTTSDIAKTTTDITEKVTSYYTSSNVDTTVNNNVPGCKNCSCQSVKTNFTDEQIVQLTSALVTELTVDKKQTVLGMSLYIYQRVNQNRISKKNRQHNGQKKKHKRTNNDLQNIHIKLKIEKTTVFTTADFFQ